MHTWQQFKDLQGGAKDSTILNVMRDFMQPLRY